MSEEVRKEDEALDAEELERQDGEPLPERKAMSVIRPTPAFDPGVTLPIERPAVECSPARPELGARFGRGFAVVPPAGIEPAHAV